VWKRFEEKKTNENRYSFDTGLNKRHFCIKNIIFKRYWQKLKRCCTKSTYYKPNNMKKLIFGLLLSSCVLLTGCIDMVEEMTLNKNGSGIYTFTIDMSSILQLGSLKDLIERGWC